MMPTCMCRRETVRGPAAIVLALLFSVLAPAGAGAADVGVSNATAHLMEDPVNGRRIEVYMTIENAGATRDRLYAVRSTYSRKTVLAVAQEDDGAAGASPHDASGHSEAAMHMPAAVIEVPPGGTVTLRHGQSHIMLTDPKDAPAVGARVPVTLFFERAGRIAVEAVVEPDDPTH